MENGEPELNMNRDALVKYMEAFVAVHEYREHYAQLIEAEFDTLEYLENVETCLELIIRLGTRRHTQSGRREMNAAVETFLEMTENFHDVVGE